MNENNLKLLPPIQEIETKRVLKQLSKSHRALAELKGYSDTIPNKNILINAITINEAKDSSEIEKLNKGKYLCLIMLNFDFFRVSPGGLQGK